MICVIRNTPVYLKALTRGRTEHFSRPKNYAADDTYLQYYIVPFLAVLAISLAHMIIPAVVSLLLPAVTVNFDL